MTVRGVYASGDGDAGGFPSCDRIRLESLDAVDYVDAHGRIHYAEWFRRHAVAENRLGKGPKRIFMEAGFPVEVLGYKRIERAMYRWRRRYGSGVDGSSASDGHSGCDTPVA